MIEDEIKKKILEQERSKSFKEVCSNLRHERRTIGIKFWDAKGTGRIVKGKKNYD